MPRYPEFGRALRAAREQAQISPRRLAAAVGVHWTYWYRMERGERRPKPEVLRRIVRTVGADYEQLARLLDYVPQPVGGYTVTVETLEQAAWLRQFAARFSADELEAIYNFSVTWVPRALVEQEATEGRARRRA